MKPNGTAVLPGAWAAALAAVILAGVALASLPVAHGQSVTFNNLQVFVNTQYQADYQYYFTAYNITGELVGTSQTPFPAAAFELPAGTYLITVSAVNQSYYGCYECVRAGGGIASSGSSGSSTTTVNSNGTTPDKNDTIPYPIYRPPTSEYGYQVVEVTGAASITIGTQNSSQLATAQVTVKVSFANGTAAAGAWVSASIIGQWYYWWGEDSGLVMSAQAGSDGVANLVIPRAPAVVSAWDWVEVKLPADQTTRPVDVGGETVNVTAYWEPMYVGLAANALVIPPTDSVDLILHYQPYNYWVTPVGAEAAPGVASDASAPSVSKAQTGVPSGTQQAADMTGSPSQFFLPNSIPALQAGTTSQGATPWMTYLAEGLLIGAAAMAVGVYSLGRFRKKTP